MDFFFWMGRGFVEVLEVYIELMWVKIEVFVIVIEYVLLSVCKFYYLLSMNFILIKKEIILFVL